MRATILQSAIMRTITHPRPSPTLFNFPGLRGLPIWPSSDLFQGHTDLLIKNYDIILKEYHAIQAIKSSDYGAEGEEHKLHNGKWDWHSYVLKGKRQVDFAVHCPKTTELLESLQGPKLMTGTPFSFAFFSTLHPKSQIAKHCAPCNLRVRCHFPLIVPKNHTIEECGMRIANKKFQWEVGKPVFFDDAYDHEVWNHTSEERVVLLLDFWHPDLVESEIEAIEEMFEDARQKGWLK
eukprot:gene7406-8192_t